MYEGYASRSVVARYLVMPHIRHVCVLLPFVMPHTKNEGSGLYIAVSLKSRTTRIWPFGCSFACATTMGCARLKLPFGIIIILKSLIIIKKRPG